jgi:hypothetical protein
MKQRQAAIWALRFAPIGFSVHRRRDMAYLVVPHEVSATTATLWVGAIDEPFDPGQAHLTSNLGEHTLPAGWERWVSQDGVHRLDYQRVIIPQLQPRSSLSLRLFVNGEPQADAKLMTLPARLPGLEEKPFTVLLGSCFCKREDAEGSVGRTYAQLPSGAHPDVKILCGDQVYLDDPWAHYLWHTHDIAELEGEFFRNYRDTWTQEPGFRQLLTDGANFLTPDDHEYWNNAPNAATVIRDSWSSTGRQEWFSTASLLYQKFQTPAPITTFGVGPLSFLIADTRSNRTSDQTDFMRPTDLQAVEQWVQELPGPGVLVLGQPVFREQTGHLWGTFGDWNLPDYDQYGQLVRLITRSPHSIVILTGDVHYGRIAWCTLSSGHELIEVISSPMSLVDKKAEGSWEEAPSLFPAFALSGSDIPVPRVRVETLAKETFSPIDSHFLTLEFSASGAHVRMTVRLWPMRRQQSMASRGFGETVYQRFLQ